MGFTEKFVYALASTDLRDDQFHYQTEALQASAIADMGAGAILGSLLSRVKFGDPMQHKDFESGAHNLAQLVGIWKGEVAKRGKERGWVTIRIDRDISTAQALYRRVAESSLAYWLDSTCKPCSGTKYVNHTICRACMGSGTADIECSGQFERDKIRDMVSELEGVFLAHSNRAASRLRRER